MDNKFYISYEAAKLLKEKGYNKETMFTYISQPRVFGLYSCGSEFNWNMPRQDFEKEGSNNIFHSFINWKEKATFYSAPTKAEAINWLESKGITIEVHRYRYDDCDNSKIYRYYILEAHIVDEPFSTRLEAEDAAIIKACELL